MFVSFPHLDNWNTFVQMGNILYDDSRRIKLRYTNEANEAHHIRTQIRTSAHARQRVISIIIAVQHNASKQKKKQQQ